MRKIGLFLGVMLALAWATAAAQVVPVLAPANKAVGEAAGGEARISWDIPAPMDPRITGYAILCRPVGVTAGGHTLTVPGATTTRLTVTGLSHGVAYNFIVRAIGGADFPVNSYDSNMITKTINAPGGVLPEVTIAADTLAGAAPLTVKFIGTVSAGSSYVWFFGDKGQEARTLTPEHIYTRPGRYTATLRGYAPGGTAYRTVTITVGPPVSP